MNRDVMDGVVQQFAQKALSYLQSAEAFTAKEVPAYVHELLAWKMAESCLEFLIYLAVVAAMVLLARRYLPAIWGWAVKNDAQPLFMLGIFPVGVAVAFSCFAAEALFAVLKISLAPRVFLIEYLGGIVK